MKILFSVILLFFLIGCSNQGKLNIIVLDENGFVSDAKIYVYDSNDTLIASKNLENGKASFNLALGEYKIKIEDIYILDPLEISLTPEKNIIYKTLQVKESQRIHEIVVHVFDLLNNSISRAKLALLKQSGEEISNSISNDKGMAIFNVTKGRYVVEASKDNKTSQKYSIDATNKRNLTHEIMIYLE